MHVVLDIFSGRPNPSWELSQEQTSEFLKKISKLKTKENFHEDSSRYELGYRGFIVEEQEQEANFAQKSRRFEAYNGIVKVVENDSSYALEDKEYSVERWLLQTATNNNVDDNLLKYVKQEIENKIEKS